MNILNEIAEYKKSLTPSYFIKERKLKKYKFNKKSSHVSANDLPCDVFLGSCYLIKNNAILESYCWCDYNFRPYINSSVSYPKWINTIIVHNIGTEIIPKHFLRENITFSSEEHKNYIIYFIDQGYELYLKKHML